MLYKLGYVHLNFDRREAPINIFKLPKIVPDFFIYMVKNYGDEKPDWSNFFLAMLWWTTLTYDILFSYDIRF